MLVQLFDAGGRLVKETNMAATTGINNGHFHLGELPSGTYTVVFCLKERQKRGDLFFNKKFRRCEQRRDYQQE